MNIKDRINGFDALRSIAMWLGVVLHSLIVYKATPSANWPHDTEAGYVFFDWLYEYIHIFRMPLFYLIAGFFSRLVILKYGLKYFLNQRFKRIFIPFVFSVFFLLPLSLLPFHFYNFFYLEKMNLEKAWTLSLMQMLHWNGFAHLWFLYYLLFFYIITVVFYWGAKKIRHPRFINLFIVNGNINFYHVSAGIGILWLILQKFHMYTPVVYTGIKPNFTYLFYYGLFFFTGWFLQMNVKGMFSVNKNAWFLFVTGSVISIVRFIYKEMQPGVFAYLLVAVETFFLVMGFIGLFLKYFNSESKSWRYFSDSSYWVYLVHLVIAASMQILLLNSIVPPFLRMPIVFSVALFFSLLSYHYLVRYTIIGIYLHGKRYKKML